MKIENQKCAKWGLERKLNGKLKRFRGALATSLFGILKIKANLIHQGSTYEGTGRKGNGAIDAYATGACACGPATKCLTFF